MQKLIRGNEWEVANALGLCVKVPWMAYVGQALARKAVELGGMKEALSILENCCSGHHRAWATALLVRHLPVDSLAETSAFAQAAGLSLPTQHQQWAAELEKQGDSLQACMHYTLGGQTSKAVQLGISAIEGNRRHSTC